MHMGKYMCSNSFQEILKMNIVSFSGRDTQSVYL